MTTPSPSELDLYINDIVEKLRKKYGYASRNRRNIFDKDKSKRVVSFYYVYETIISFSPNFVEIPYTELKECMEKNTLPTEIQKLL